jgi:hypothetical protein
MPLPAAPDATVPPRPREGEPAPKRFSETKVLELMARGYDLGWEDRAKGRTITLEAIQQLFRDHTARQQGA